MAELTAEQKMIQEMALKIKQLEEKLKKTPVKEDTNSLSLEQHDEPQHTLSSNADDALIDGLDFDEPIPTPNREESQQNGVASHGDADEPEYDNEACGEGDEEELCDFDAMMDMLEDSDDDDVGNVASEAAAIPCGENNANSRHSSSDDAASKSTSISPGTSRKSPVSSQTNAVSVVPSKRKSLEKPQNKARKLIPCDVDLFPKPDLRLADTLSKSSHMQADEEDMSPELNENGTKVQMLLDRQELQQRARNDLNEMRKSEQKSMSKPLSSSLPSSKKSSNEQDIMIDPFSCIAIINPLVSSAEMKRRVDSRRVIRLSALPKKVNTSDVDGDWITIGVVVHKSERKTTKNDKPFAIWSLCDLSDCTVTIKMYLFGDVFKSHWKISIGSVIGLLNPTITEGDANSKYASQLTLKIDRALKLMPMGTSRDFATCRSMTKAGNKCTNVVNKSRGAVCNYHVQSAYKKHSSNRPEVQSGFSGVIPRSFEKKLFQKKGEGVSYQGMSFMNPGNSKPTKPRVSLQGLVKHEASNVKGQRLTTLTLSDSRFSNKRSTDSATMRLLNCNGGGGASGGASRIADSGASRLAASGASRPAASGVASRTATIDGRVVGTKSLQEKRSKLTTAAVPGVKSGSSSSNSSSNIAVNSSPAGVRKTGCTSTHRLASEKSAIASPGQRSVVPAPLTPQSQQDKFYELMRNPTAGSLNLVRHLVKVEDQRSATTTTTSSPGSQFKDSHVEVKRKPMTASDLIKQESDKRAVQKKALAHVPQLGRGLKMDSASFDLDSPLPVSLTSKRNQAAKMKAIESVRKSGGIKSRDKPLNYSKTIEFQQNIAKRIANKDADENGENIKEPASKKSRMVGNFDLNDEKTKTLLSRRSIHDTSLKEIDAQNMDVYFEALEAKEQLETQMLSITQQTVKVVTCHVCKYTAYKETDRCKSLMHSTRRHQASKRFFECSKCKRRCCSFSKIPSRPCDGCGEHNFTKVSMHKERKGPVSEKDIFEKNLRGGENKFLG